jgi:hypothetical protein
MDMKQDRFRGLIFDRNKKQEKRKRVGNGLNGTESTCAVSSVFNSGIFVVVKVALGQVYLRLIRFLPASTTGSMLPTSPQFRASLGYLLNILNRRRSLKSICVLGYVW